MHIFASQNVLVRINLSSMNSHRYCKILLICSSAKRFSLVFHLNNLLFSSILIIYNNYWNKQPFYIFDNTRCNQTDINIQIVACARIDSHQVIICESDRLQYVAVRKWLISNSRLIDEMWTYVEEGSCRRLSVCVCACELSYQVSKNLASCFQRRTISKLRKTGSQHLFFKLFRIIFRHPVYFVLIFSFEIFVAERVAQIWRWFDVLVRYVCTIQCRWCKLKKFPTTGVRRLHFS